MTYLTCLTPPGSGAIAVLEVTGPGAWVLTRDLFRSARTLPDTLRPGGAWFGRMGPGAGDEVMLVAPQDRAEPTVEIHCHGGMQVVRMLTDLLVEAGCSTTADANDTHSFAERAGRLLPYAKTLRTAGILLDQANGAFDREIEKLKRQPDEVQRNQLLNLAALGRHLVEPWRVAVIGAPNAGKSSLMNALAGFQRSVVAPIPGTTRDVVTLSLAFDGWLMQLADTAGLREAGDDLERDGIARAHQQMAMADVCLWVIDATESPPDRPMAECVIPVLNKIDLPPAFDLACVGDAVCVSALTGAGIPGLIDRLVRTLVPEVPATGTAVPFDEDCIRALKQLS